MSDSKNGTSSMPPDKLFASLLEKGGRSNRIANLTKIQEICRNRYQAGSRDFSLPSIGRLTEAEGIIKGRALYNAASADYRMLIEAWGLYAGPSIPKPTKLLASHEYLMRIEDPAIRSIMQSIISERDKLKAQVNILKSNIEVTVDRRPNSPTVGTNFGNKSLTVLAMSNQLTLSEEDALKKSISPDYLEERGFKEGTHGEILNDRGRTIFEVGFARAIRKILGD